MALLLDFLDFMLGMGIGVTIVAGLQLIRYLAWVRKKRP